jgi:hypothetical protein
MADPTTLKALADLRLAAAQSGSDSARSEYSAAQTAVTDAVAASAAAATALAKAKADGDKARTALAAIPTGADATPLVAALDAATVARRAAELAVLDAERGLALTRARLERASSAMRTSESAKLAATAEAKAADLESQRIAKLFAALSGPPLDSVAQDATDLLVAPEAAAAQAAAEKDLPTKLLERARDRVTIARKRAENRAKARDDLADLLADQIDAKGSTADKLASPRANHARALDALEPFVRDAQQGLDSAAATLAQLADPKQKAVLTAAEIDRLTDATLEADRETAADNEKAWNEAQRDRELAEQARDLEQAKKATGLPDTLAAKETALTQAKQKELDALADHQTTRATLDLWEAEVPDAFWSDLADYDRANAMLTELAAAVPANLGTDLAAKEKDLVSALLALDRERAAAALYAAAIETRQAEIDFDSSAGQRRLLAALRGDG